MKEQMFCLRQTMQATELELTSSQRSTMIFLVLLKFYDDIALIEGQRLGGWNDKCNANTDPN